ncbi:MAG: AAA family ATPase [Bacteroidetes bacterium]|nr:AAA family ATPase [Bacteroidota bacterium]
MDPIRNPFAPGAGTPPPELAGRDALRETVRIAVARTRIGRPAKSLLMVGLRGVGKTVLLDRMRDDAEATGVHTLRIEAPEGRSLPGILLPQLRLALLRLSRNERAEAAAKRALRALAGFFGAIKVKYGDVEVGLDYEPERGLADNGDLDQDLQALLEEAAKAAQKAETALVLFVDELQYVPEEELAALITAIHFLSQRQLPLMMVGAGLPQLRGQMGRAKSYAERLFDFPELTSLDRENAALAIRKPLEEEGVAIEPEALEDLLRQTQGYPYFLQEWGKHTWEVAEKSPITKADTEHATVLALAALDASFFRVRLDRLTPAEVEYLWVMAVLGPGPHRSGDIAEKHQRAVQSLAPIRHNLIRKGMIYSPTYGDTAFTVPLFDAYMRRVMPDRPIPKEA